MRSTVDQPTTMENLPLHFFLANLIEGCQELPEIISDNAKSRGLDNDANGCQMMDGSVHSTGSSLGGSSRWESIPRKDKTVDCPRRPSREAEPPTPTSSTPDNIRHNNHSRTRSMGMKQPTRTRSSDDITVLKDGMAGRRSGQRPSSGSSVQSRKAYLVPSSPTGSAGDVQKILDQALVELHLTESL